MKWTWCLNDDGDNKTRYIVDQIRRTKIQLKIKLQPHTTKTTTTTTTLQLLLLQLLLLQLLLLQLLLQLRPQFLLQQLVSLISSQYYYKSSNYYYWPALLLQLWQLTRSGGEAYARNSDEGKLDDLACLSCSIVLLCLKVDYFAQPELLIQKWLEISQK